MNVDVGVVIAIKAIVAVSVIVEGTPSAVLAIVEMCVWVVIAAAVMVIVTVNVYVGKNPVAAIFYDSLHEGAGGPNVVV